MPEVVAARRQRDVARDLERLVEPFVQIEHVELETIAVLELRLEAEELLPRFELATVGGRDVVQAGLERELPDGRRRAGAG